MFGLVTASLFLARAVTDIEILLIWAPYASITTLVQALLADVTFNSLVSSYAFTEKQLLTFFREMESDLFAKAIKEVDAAYYYILQEHYHRIPTSFTSSYGDIPTDKALLLFYKQVNAIFLANAKKHKGAIFSEAELKRYIHRTRTWLESTLYYDARKSMPLIRSSLILILSFIYPFSGCLIILLQSSSVLTMSNTELGVISGLVSSTLASFWIELFKKLKDTNVNN